MVDLVMVDLVTVDTSDAVVEAAEWVVDCAVTAADTLADWAP